MSKQFAVERDAMKKGSIRMHLNVAAVVMMSLMTSAVAESRDFEQDRFAIGFWVDPPADENMDAHYKDIAAADFTMVVGGFGARTPENVRRQITLCERYDLKAVVSRAGLEPDKLPDSPAVWGYMIRDEPSAKDFPALRKTADEVCGARPGKMAYINIFPDYASEEQLGTSTYDEHVRRFVNEVGVEVLSMDHYPVMKPGDDRREGYLGNLGIMRKYSLIKDIPFWNYFNTMPFGVHSDPTEAQLRWQIYTSIAYGAKGVMYFCYWTPGGGEFPKGGAIITSEGLKTRHYDQAARINHDIKNLGPTIMKLTSTGVYKPAEISGEWRIYEQPEGDQGKVTDDRPLKSISEGDYLIGVFKHEDNRQAVMVNNYSYSFTAWPTVEFSVPADQVREISKETGEEIPVLDDSPAMEGLQISLDSGDGRLFILSVE